MRMTRT